MSWYGVVVPPEHPLADPMMRQALLRLLCEGKSKTAAVKEIGIGASPAAGLRSLQRYLAKDDHDDFRAKVAQAVVLGEDHAADPRFIDRLVASEAPPIPPAPEPPIDDPLDLEPATLPVMAEIVERSPPSDPDDPFVGVNPFSERALMALSWRLIHDPNTPVTIHAVHARCLYDHMKNRQRRATLLEMGARSSAGTAPISTERGLTQEAVRQFRRAVIGPNPGEDDESAA